MMTCLQRFDTVVYDVYKILFHDGTFLCVIFVIIYYIAISYINFYYMFNKTSH